MFMGIRDHVSLSSFLLQLTTLLPTMAEWEWGLFHGGHTSTEVFHCFGPSVPAVIPKPRVQDTPARCQPAASQ